MAWSHRVVGLALPLLHWFLDSDPSCFGEFVTLTICELFGMILVILVAPHWLPMISWLYTNDRSGYTLMISTKIGGMVLML